MFSIFKRKRSVENIIIHHGSDAHIPGLPTYTKFTREGTGTTTITGDVEKGSTILITNGSVIIEGNIHAGCKIQKEGIGFLTIKGSVDEDLKLTVYGDGNVSFERFPPYNVKRAIKKRTGNSIISCAGVPIESPQFHQHYIRNNMGLVTVNRPVVDRVAAPVPIQPVVIPLPPPVIKKAESNINFQDAYNSLTEAYIEHYKDYKTIAERIAELNLTKEERKLFKGFKDCIMMSYFDSLPVMYDERAYGLNTLLELYRLHKPDPYTKNPLKLVNIASARTLLNSFEEVVNELKKRREALREATDPIVDSEPEQQSLSF